MAVNKETDKEAEVDLHFMQQALDQARLAAVKGEVPVGAVVVFKNKIVSKGFNIKEIKKTPLGHAELVALHRAAKTLGRWRLNECTLYVTLEPCAMCAGAIVQSRISRIVYAATDPKAGAVESLYEICSDSRLNHHPAISVGILAQESQDMLKAFFKKLRAKNN